MTTPSDGAGPPPEGPYPGARNPQHMRGLTEANRIRPMRAEMKRQLIAGHVDPFLLIEGNVNQWEDTVARTKCRYVLEAITGIGRVTADEILRVMGVRPDGDTRFGDLSFEGRKRMANLVRDSLGVEHVP